MMVPMIEKTICNECRYLLVTTSCPERCTYPDNIIRKENWYMKWNVHKKSPKILNKNLSCLNFKKISKPVNTT